MADHAPGWAKTGAAARADLLNQVIADTMAAQDDWLAAACAAKGLDAGVHRGGRGALRRRRHLRAHGPPAPRLAARNRRDGKPSFAGPIREAADGRLRVQVFPAGTLDRIMFPQTTAEVWMQPGVTRDALAAGQAPAYADPVAHAGTALVLAAGNVASLGPRDVLSKLFVEGKVGRHEGQPGQRLPGAALEPRPGPARSTPACCASSTAAPRSAST